MPSDCLLTAINFKYLGLRIAEEVSTNPVATEGKWRTGADDDADDGAFHNSPPYKSDWIEADVEVRTLDQSAISAVGFVTHCVAFRCHGSVATLQLLGNVHVNPK